MKPITPKMLDILMECHERELLKQEPLGGTRLTQNTKGLIQRALLKANMHAHQQSGKPYMAYFITKEGKEYLNKFLKLAIE